ncbi:hypothetical protein [Chryseobacterium profundimaris]|uniref:Uncharacterized protein n=1 Tax=Chryseobacterium profundimaris TaxID=1387275 RepID=A0ABY1NXQ9_9FLAO|nr:hypothetical protein [Chryseobacterium profundimaris]SMP21316.1 hypothetical protein SAMN06264346_10639 [Chryseobacterium profundimaris]
MEDFSIGDFVCFKNHPYFENNTFIKIASNASITPPVMIVGETLDKKEYDSLTGKPIEKQLRCYYYSHKDGKFNNNWFKQSELKRLVKKDSYLDLDRLESIEKYEIDYLKETYLHNLVCLKNVDFELNKKKVFFENSDGLRSNKEQNHLDFLPPVMTIIDIVKNKDEKRFSTKDSKFSEKDCSKYMFKCRWYNPQTISYSEDFLPSNILGLVVSHDQALTTIKNLKQKDVFYLYPFDKPLELEDSSVKLKNSLIKVNEIIFNHYYYNFEYFDLLFQKRIAKPIIKINSFIENTNTSKDCLSNEMVFGRSYPSYKRNYIHIDSNIFTNNEYFLINYTDKLKNSTKRIIKVIGIDTFTDTEGQDYTFVVANCLLREGRIRHFNIDKITKVVEIRNGTTFFE